MSTKPKKQPDGSTCISGEWKGKPHLVGNEVDEEVVLGGGALEVEVVGEVALHPAGVVGAEAAHGDERDDGHRHLGKRFGNR